MLETLLWIIVGMFIGWNLAQPQWAKDLQQRIMDMFKS